MNLDASEEYQNKRDEVVRNVWTIRKQLVEMDKAQNAMPENWAYAGSLGYVNSELKDIIRFMGGKVD